jgi:hypothetical protein
MLQIALIQMNRDVFRIRENQVKLKQSYLY